VITVIVEALPHVSVVRSGGAGGKNSLQSIRYFEFFEYIGLDLFRSTYNYRYS
jgi:hypothetical protein